MNSNLYKQAGVAAILLAVLYPVYWLAVVGFALDGYQESIRADFLTLNGWDALFVIIGALEIMVYLALRRMFQDQLNGTVPGILLLIMAVLVALFHSTVFADVFFAMGLFTDAVDKIIDVLLIAGLILHFLFTIVALIFAISLLVKFNDFSTVMKIFACGMLIVAVFDMTVILGVVNIFLFPVLLLLLAVQFLRGEQEVEVV
ncbi:MAG: hypothetical protein JJU10_00185 [Idiomarina sp.]|nr:hypothetical protein [Idiomarina sp.]